jgi:hypothetical protein
MICIDNKPLKGNEVAPPLTIGKSYTLKDMYQCRCGQKHYDVGLNSKYNWISCYKCTEPIPKGDLIHWCHPSRFKE